MDAARAVMTTKLTTNFFWWTHGASALPSEHGIQGSSRLLLESTGHLAVLGLEAGERTVAPLGELPWLVDRAPVLQERVLQELAFGAPALLLLFSQVRLIPLPQSPSQL